MQKTRGPNYVFRPATRKLPSYSVIKALYLGGATYAEIGAPYRVRWASVQGYLQRQARQHGDPWPFARPIPQRPQLRVDSGVITDLIRESIETQGISAYKWSHDHGVSYSTVASLFRKPTPLRLESAKRLLVALDEPVPKWIEDTLRAREGRKKSVASSVSRATDSGMVRNFGIVDREGDAGGC